MSGIIRAMAISVAALLFLLGCTGVSEGDKCVGKTQVTINGVTKVCVDGKMTGSCTAGGQVYDDSSDSKVVCEGGAWVRKESANETGSQPAAGSGPAVQANTSTQGGTDGAAEPECSGKSFVTVNGETEGCVDGKMSSACTTDAEVYTESDFFQSKVVCRGGIWVEEELAPGENVTSAPEETSEEEGPCMGTSWGSADNVTKACVGGVWTTECASEGEVYDVSDFLETKIVCEGGVWVAKDLE